ncbi:hypothetical protein SKAU_G00350770 [Synaphobranchus kaupii]|uniref:Uncharacterized protein n=1 Tax=Synaphobranchus kaupii TaxID=118154 RepID=A0A9Q1EKB6_SYNKA|nr:hypothetical protein SKAU_G00350770 [Synaphobranchus kaupii]
MVFKKDLLSLQLRQLKGNHSAATAALSVFTTSRRQAPKGPGHLVMPRSTGGFGNGIDRAVPRGAVQRGSLTSPASSRLISSS